MPEWWQGILDWVQVQWQPVHDWLQQPIVKPENGAITLETLVLRLGAAFLLGCMVAVIYAITTRAPGRVTSRPFLATMVLLSILIALVTFIVGDNTARAFSLVGVLAIVRFRTVVEDTRDTAFVIFAVVVGMASGAGYYTAPILGAPLILFAAWLFKPGHATTRESKSVLALRLAATNPPLDAVRKALDKHLRSYRLAGAGTARGGSALDVTYRVQPKTGEAVLALVEELSRVDGVQSVELKET